jgi:hypothetical protein
LFLEHADAESPENKNKNNFFCIFRARCSEGQETGVIAPVPENARKKI